MRPIPRRLGTFLTGLLVASAANAHDVDLTRVSVEFAADGTYQVDLYYDADAWLAGILPRLFRDENRRQYEDQPAAARQKREAELKDYVLRRIRIRFDESLAQPEVTLPLLAEAAGSQPTEGLRMRRIVRLSGRVPDGARTFDFWASKSFGHVALLIHQSGADRPSQQLLDFATRSTPYSLRRGDESSGALSVIRQYVGLGYEHILPEGLDHILFVLGLFLLSDKLGSLLWQVTAFTVAHTITLALSSFGVISLSPRIVEPLIALSIAYVGIENVCTTRLHAWRPVVVFLFGLLHGMGFAGVLSELGLPRQQFAVALISFNAGVELGQATVILLAFASVGWFRKKPWYRKRLVVPASLAISAVGLYWAIQRIGG